jgi:hypothetical protein
MKYSLEHYDRITFTEGGVRIHGWRIGKYLAVMKHKSGYKIYKVLNKSYFIRTIFKVLKHAIQFAEWADEKFGEYFPIWDDYPDADVVSMAKWTIDDGLRLNELIRHLSDTPEIENLSEINDLYHKVEKDAQAWISGFRSYI